MLNTFSVAHLTHYYVVHRMCGHMRGKRPCTQWSSAGVQLCVVLSKLEG